MRTAVILTVLALGACSGSKNLAPWELEGRPGLLLPITQYYEANATQQTGRCSSPEMKGVSGSEVVSETEDQLEVRVRYFYIDRSRDDRGECRGFGERRFTVVKGADGYQVIGMTGDLKSAC